jgi:hypothetical protein
MFMGVRESGEEMSVIRKAAIAEGRKGLKAVDRARKSSSVR